MPEIRQNIATGDWVIVATERAKRPEDFKPKAKEKIIRPEKVENCPFCPGNENNTPQEVLSVKDTQGNWIIRVTPNKFCALKNEGEPVKTFVGTNPVVSGVGIHEVIIETPLHNLTTALYPVEHIEKIIQVYKTRYCEIKKDPRISQIIIFKNHGESAGTSLEHPHSQLVATPVVPTSIQGRFDTACNYYAKNKKCVFCQMVEEETKSAERVVAEDEHFIVIEPFGSYSPFHTWILPKAHKSSFGDIADDEIKSLAKNLKQILSKFYYGLDNPDFNYCIRSSSIELDETKYFHWYLALVPRLTKLAGFEMGSGMFINTSLPEQCAEFLRNVDATKKVAED